MEISNFYEHLFYFGLFAIVTFFVVAIILICVIRWFKRLSSSDEFKKFREESRRLNK